jgi:hypothetical protein
VLVFDVSGTLLGLPLAAVEMHGKRKHCGTAERLIERLTRPHQDDAGSTRIRYRIKQP